MVSKYVSSFLYYCYTWFNYKNLCDYYMFFEDDNLFIIILITLGICLIMNVGWLELTLMYVGIVLLNGL